MKILLITLTSLLYLSTFAQERLTTLDIERLAKLKTLRYSSNLGVIKKNEFFKIDSLIEQPDFFKIQPLKSKGFKNFTFYKISFAEIDFFEYLIYDRKPKLPLFFEFVLAYDIGNNRFYQLKGFLNNDFPIFYNEFLNRVSKKDRGRLNKNNKKRSKCFVKNYFIESLDLKILIDNINNINDWKIIYLRPVPSRLMITEHDEYLIQ